jgi:hypothetical protein
MNDIYLLSIPSQIADAVTLALLKKSDSTNVVKMSKNFLGHKIVTSIRDYQLTDTYFLLKTVVHNILSCIKWATCFGLLNHHQARIKYIKKDKTATGTRSPTSHHKCI